MSKKRKNEDNFFQADNGDSISMLAEIHVDQEAIKVDFSKEIPVLPLRNMTMFPLTVMPVTIGRPSTLKLVNAAYKKKAPIAVISQLSSDTEDPGFQDLYHVGVVAHILRIFDMPGGCTTVV